MDAADGRKQRVTAVEQLMAAWSSGDPDAPRDLVTDSFVVWDAVGGEHQGWEAVRAYFSSALVRWPDLELVPDGNYWFSDEGVAFTWVMTATVPDDRFGPDRSGRPWRSPGMSFVTFDGDLICREVDFHDGGAVLRSLDEEASRS